MPLFFSGNNVRSLGTLLNKGTPRGRNFIFFRESWGLELVNHGDWNNDSSAAKISVPVPCDSHPAQPETSPVIRIRQSRKHENPLHIFRPCFLTPS